MTERHATLFRNGRSQAMRIPREMEMEGTEVLIRKEGDNLILTPIRKHKLRDLLASWTPMEEALSELIRNPQGTLAEKLNALDSDAICTSSVAACELRFGAELKGSVPLTERVEQRLQPLAVLSLDTPTDEHYADIRATLERSGTPIGSHDPSIAAHARSRGMTLLTRNLREFERVPGLSVEDWPTGAV
ncbi:MAG: PIN domain-containing protein [Gammaproteobacteria bacterium]